MNGLSYNWVILSAVIIHKTENCTTISVTHYFSVVFFFSYFYHTISIPSHNVNSICFVCNKPEARAWNASSTTLSHQKQWQKLLIKTHSKCIFTQRYYRCSTSISIECAILWRMLFKVHCSIECFVYSLFEWAKYFKTKLRMVCCAKFTVKQLDLYAKRMSVSYLCYFNYI